MKPVSWHPHFSSVGARTAATLLAAILVCVAVIAFDISNGARLRGALAVLSEFRQARIDLDQAFLHLTLSGTDDSPWQRGQGRALLAQSRIQFERAVAADDDSLDSDELKARIGDFSERVMRLGGQQPIDPRTMIELRASFHQLSDTIARVDARHLGALSRLQSEQNQRFLIAMIAAAILLTMMTIGTIRAARQRSDAVAALGDSEERFRRLFSDAALPMVVVDGDGNFVARNEQFERTFGYGVADVSSADEWWKLAYPDPVYRAQVVAQWTRQIKRSDEKARVETNEYRVTCKDGSERFMMISGIALRGQILVAFSDVTERHRAEQALVEQMHQASRAQHQAEDAQAKLAAALAAMSDAVFISDAEGRLIHFNDAVVTNYRFKTRDECARTFADYVPLFDVTFADGEPAPVEMWAMPRALRGETATDQEYGLRRKDTGESWICSYNLAPIRDRSGAIVGSVVTSRDITQRKQAEAQLRDSQAQLLQSQKLEAIGQLTGGVAHDFNNLLTVIIANLDMLTTELDAGSEHRELAEAALGAASRGAGLTRQLLSFARRQKLLPRPVDLNDLVGGMTRLFQRTLGEDITIETRLSVDVDGVMADPGQLENALLNLAVNARDAMPRGGRLTIATGLAMLDDDYARIHPDVLPGLYECIAVTDTGHGMPAEVAARAFEPFFTTKEVGKGTGLGLSMVYGFAKQSGGHAALYSEPGRGTTVKIYLPSRAPGAGQPPAETAGAEHRGHGQRILLVEDNPDVQKILLWQLKSLGYYPHAVRDGPEALAYVTSGGTMELLITDIVMPGGMNGVEVAAALRRDRPDLKVLFISGYPGGVPSSDAIVVEGGPFLEKPFTRAQLSEAVAGSLARP